MAKTKLLINNSWKEFFNEEKQKPYFPKLLSDIKKEYQSHRCFPSWPDIFAAFYWTTFEQVKVIILGQDPYHQPGQAHGLAFSVQDNVLPPSLQNIFKELENDLGIKHASGSLVNWAKQGVLLLNTTLTVRQSQPNSHQNYDWSIFTDNLIKYIDKNKNNLVFVLWGQNARSKKPLINLKNHLIIEGVHPSPLSAYRGFFNSAPFSKINTFLIENNKSPINWHL